MEEYFKAVKTGCSFEERGLKSLDSLVRCLVIFSAIACKLHNIKIIGRNNPEKSSEGLATEVQKQILAKLTKKTTKDLETAGALMGAIAQLGGHIKYNGPPGWQVLFRGYEKLVALEEGFYLATQINAARHV